jgi:hypothetical protein
MSLAVAQDSTPNVQWDHAKKEAIVKLNPGESYATLQDLLTSKGIFLPEGYSVRLVGPKGDSKVFKATDGVSVSVTNDGSLNISTFQASVPPAILTGTKGGEMPGLKYMRSFIPIQILQVYAGQSPSPGASVK